MGKPYYMYKFIYCKFYWNCLLFKFVINAQGAFFLFAIIGEYDIMK